jgi:D-alanine transaminase
MADVLYVDGRFTTTDEPVITVEDRSFLFGDGVYETLKFLRKRPTFAADHYSRLLSSLRSIEIPSPWPTEESFIRDLSELLRRTAFGDGIVYVQVSRGSGERKHAMPEEMKPFAIMYSRVFAFPDARRKELGISVITTDDLRWQLCHVKSVNLLGNVLAKTEALRAGADEALFVSGGEVREGSSSSFFAIRDGRLITHPNQPCILPGITRDHAITIALELRIRVDERPLRETELFGLEEAFITSTTQSIMPVTTIDGRVVANGRRGDITARVQERFDELERLEIG